MNDKHIEELEKRIKFLEDKLSFPVYPQYPLYQRQPYRCSQCGAFLDPNITHTCNGYVVTYKTV